MKNEKQTLVLIQKKEKILFVQDIRGLGHLLNAIELLHKTALFYSDKDEALKKLALPERIRLYKSEYRIKIQKINKNSPLEVHLAIKSLFASVEIIDILFTDEQQELTIKRLIEKHIGIDFNLPANKKLWKQIWNAIRGAKKFIRVLDLIYDTR